ncbi:MAG: AAA family ATPase [Candidatus Hermodarchaeota archaeon]
MKVIGFCGLPGSGKSTAIEAISDLGKIITMGDIIRNEAEIRKIEPTAENLGKIASDLRIKKGPEIIAKKCIEFIKNLSNDVIFIDGLRSIYEVNEFRKNWKFPIIKVILNEDLRFKRLFKRGRSDDPSIIKQLKQRDNRELSLGLKDVLNKADYKISNDSSIESLKKNARTCFNDN